MPAPVPVVGDSTYELATRSRRKFRAGLAGLPCGVASAGAASCSHRSSAPPHTWRLLRLPTHDVCNAHNGLEPAPLAPSGPTPESHTIRTDDEAGTSIGNHTFRTLLAAVTCFASGNTDVARFTQVTGYAPVTSGRAQSTPRPSMAIRSRRSLARTRARRFFVLVMTCPLSRRCSDLLFRFGMTPSDDRDIAFENKALLLRGVWVNADCQSRRTCVCWSPTCDRHQSQRRPPALWGRSRAGVQHWGRYGPNSPA